MLLVWPITGQWLVGLAGTALAVEGALRGVYVHAAFAAFVAFHCLRRTWRIIHGLRSVKPSPKTLLYVSGAAVAGRVLGAERIGPAVKVRYEYDVGGRTHAGETMIAPGRADAMGFEPVENDSAFIVYDEAQPNTHLVHGFEPAPSGSDLDNPLSFLTGMWAAHPGHPDFIQSVLFRRNGTGRVSSGGGQAICLDVDFKFRLIAANRLELEFLRTERPFGRYEPTAASSKLGLTFEIVEGDFKIGAPGFARTYGRKIVFADSPLPIDAAGYHEGSLFFTVVNKIDPRSFHEFYSLEAWRAA